MSSDTSQLRDAALRDESAFRWEEAARTYEEALTRLEGDDPREQAALLFRLGHCYRNMAEARSSWRSLMRAITIYRDLGNATLLAEATLEALQIWAPPERQRALAESALEAIGPGESRVHAALLLHMDRLDEGRAMAERNGYADMVAGVDRWQAFHLVEEGRIDEYVALSETAHEAYVAAGEHDRAIGMLRSAGYEVLASGRIDDGVLLTNRALAYARKRRMRFHEQLAALDVAGVFFVRFQLDRCSQTLDEIPGGLDFRKDLFRAWIAEQRGDRDAAIAALPDPERAGGAHGAVSQLHGGRAGVLWRAGKERAAQAELGAWAEAARNERRLLEDAPAVLEPLIAVGEEALLREIIEAKPDWPWMRYATLQGRGMDRARGAVAARLGRLDEAERHYRTGAVWAAEQRCPLEQAQCLRGIAEITAIRGGTTASY